VEFPDDAGRAGTDSSKVFVALCPFQAAGLPRSVRGVFPLLVEAVTLWHYAMHHQRVPALNDNGRGHEVPTMPDLDGATLRELLSGDDRSPAARALVHSLAVALGYASHRQHQAWIDGEWSGVKRPLGGGLWLLVGWRASGPGVKVMVVRRENTWFGSAPDEGPASTATELRTLVERLWSRWHTE